MPVSEDLASGPTVQQQRSERSTRRMLQAASELIVEGGYQKMTLAAVGERAGYSRGLATARFGSKEQLHSALMTWLTSDWIESSVSPMLKEHSGLDTLVGIFDAIADRIETDPHSFQALHALAFDSLTLGGGARESFVRIHRTFLDAYTSLIRRGQRDGSIRADLDARAEAALVLSSIRGIGFHWMLDPAAFDARSTVAYLAAVSRERLAARAGPEPAPPDDQSR